MSEIKTQKQLTQKVIIDPMRAVRKYCSLGHKLRTRLNIPVSYPLYEAQINTLGTTTLLKDHLQLIADELNIKWVEPIQTTWSKYATIETIEEDGYSIMLDVTKDHYLEREYQERKEHRKRMKARKEKGLTYTI